jgi:hypothetical protein
MLESKGERSAGINIEIGVNVIGGSGANVAIKSGSGKFIEVENVGEVVAEYDTNMAVRIGSYMAVGCAGESTVGNWCRGWCKSRAEGADMARRGWC